MNTRISILVIATAVLFLAGCTKKDVKKSAKSEVPVSVVDVVSGSISDAHEYIVKKPVSVNVVEIKNFFVR